jgi:hypothetical protein
MEEGAGVSGRFSRVREFWPSRRGGRDGSQGKGSAVPGGLSEETPLWLADGGRVRRPRCRFRPEMDEELPGEGSRGETAQGEAPGLGGGGEDEVPEDEVLGLEEAGLIEAVGLEGALGHDGGERRAEWSEAGGGHGGPGGGGELVDGLAAGVEGGGGGEQEQPGTGTEEGASGLDAEGDGLVAVAEAERGETEGRSALGEELLEGDGVEAGA